jgi:hypothetical protein
VAAARGWSTFLSGSRAANCSQTGSMMYGGTAGMERLLQFGKLQQLPEMIWKSMSFYIQIPSLLAQALGPADVVQKLKLQLETTHKLGEPASQTPDSG